MKVGLTFVSAQIKQIRMLMAVKTMTYLFYFINDVVMVDPIDTHLHET